MSPYELRDGETPDRNAHAEANLEMIRQLEEELADEDDREDGDGDDE